MTYTPMVSNRELSDSSTTTPLAAGATFTGTPIFVQQYSSVNITVVADTDSAENGVQIQFSADEVTWPFVTRLEYRANSGFVKSVPTQGTYFRLVYTNNANTAQTSFSATCYAMTTAARPPGDGAYDNTGGADDGNGNGNCGYTYVVTSGMHLSGIADDTETGVTSLGGSQTYVFDAASVDLEVTSTGGSSALRQTRSRGAYRSGTRFLVSMTGVINLGGNGALSTAQIGYVDDNDGVYFQYSNLQMAVAIRSSTSGAPVDTVVTQANWNLDTLDGTGASGLTVDFSKTQTLLVELVWPGYARAGVVVKGVAYMVHAFRFSNTATVPYMRCPYLPVRYAVVSAGAAAAVRMTSYSITSECAPPAVGGYVMAFSERLSTEKRVTTAPVPLLSLKLRTDLPLVANAELAAAVAIPNNGESVVSFDVYLFRDVPDPTTVLPGAVFTNVGGGSSMMVDYAATSIVTTTAVRIASGYSGMSTTVGDIGKIFAAVPLITRNAVGSSDIVALVASSISGSVKTLGIVQWTEQN